MLTLPYYLEIGMFVINCLISDQSTLTTQNTVEQKEVIQQFTEPVYSPKTVRTGRSEDGKIVEIYIEPTIFPN